MCATVLALKVLKVRSESRYLIVICKICQSHLSALSEWNVLWENLLQGDCACVCMSQFWFPPRVISDQSGHIFPDWFSYFILPVNHRCVKCNTPQWWTNVEREGAEREGAFVVILKYPSLPLFLCALSSAPYTNNIYIYIYMLLNTSTSTTTSD